MGHDRRPPGVGRVWVAADPAMVEVATAKLRALCLEAPGSSEKVSHGEPSWWVGGRQFAMMSTFHHDDRLAVWLNAPEGAQEALVGGNPDRYYVPPYVGIKGWLGARLEPDRVDWEELAMLVDQARAVTLEQGEAAKRRRRA